MSQEAEYTFKNPYPVTISDEETENIVYHGEVDAFPALGDTWGQSQGITDPPRWYLITKVTPNPFDRTIYVTVKRKL